MFEKEKTISHGNLLSASSAYIYITLSLCHSLSISISISFYIYITLCIYIYVCNIYICIYIYVYLYIYLYLEVDSYTLYINQLCSCWLFHFHTARLLWRSGFALRHQHRRKPSRHRSRWGLFFFVGISIENWGRSWRLIP